VRYLALVSPGWDLVLARHTIAAVSLRDHKLDARDIALSKVRLFPPPTPIALRLALSSEQFHCLRPNIVHDLRRLLIARQRR